MNSPSIDEVLNRAFNLACFILADRKSAIQSVEEAMARLDVTTAAQGKRLYYKPSASEWIRGKNHGRYRNKVFFGETHLLQRLIYIASEAFERHKERSLTAGDAAEKEMLIHFIKHLVRITTRRNSFYVTLGINRLLYNYTTAETMETYNAVIQDPARVKDDYYYRSRKGVLMQELKNRFGRFLDVARGPRGEERFHASERQGRFADLVNECLSVFTPWDTCCLVPAGLNPIVDGIPVLSSRGRQDEDKIEVDRIHAVLHPDCHERLVKLLGFESRETRLEVPQFFLMKGSGTTSEGPGGSRESSSNLSNNELGEIKAHLDEQSAHRKRAFVSILRIVVDGTERARLVPSRTASTRFVLDSDAEMIEVRAMVNGKDLLLASHLFVDRELVGSSKLDATSIMLEGGQKVSITVSAAENATETLVDVAYRESGLLRAAILYLKQPLSSSDGESLRLRWRPARVVPALALGLVVLALSVLGITRFMRDGNSESFIPGTASNNQQARERGSESPPILPDNRERSSDREGVLPLASSTENKDKTSRKSTDVPSGTQVGKTESATVAGSNEGQRPPVVTRDRDVASRNSSSTESNASTSGRSTRVTETTRTLSGEAEAIPLSDIKKIYVEVSGNAALREKARQQLIVNLNGSERFLNSETKDNADALLRISVTSPRRQSMRLVARVILINSRGETIWTGGNSRGVFKGSYESVAADIVRGLLDEASKRMQR